MAPVFYLIPLNFCRDLARRHPAWAIMTLRILPNARLRV
jgi:hypothetical protein